MPHNIVSSQVFCASRQHNTLSIVIVNSDGLRDTLACLASIYRYPPKMPYEVVVVDNCSREPSLEVIHQQFSAVRTFMAPHRQGFARNYNLGIRQACGSYVLVLNNDTLIQADALDTLLEALETNPHYGLVGPYLSSPDGSIQAVCARVLPTPLGYVIAQLILDPGFPPGQFRERLLQRQATDRTSGPVPCISGACMLMSQTDLATIGLLDEGYDFYYEDIEWCHRFQRHGREVGYVAEANVVHLGDQSLGKVKVWAKQSEYRSALRYFSHYYALTAHGRDLIWLVTLLNFFLRGFAMLLTEALTGERRYAREYMYLWGWLLSQRPV